MESIQNIQVCVSDPPTGVALEAFTAGAPHVERVPTEFLIIKKIAICAWMGAVNDHAGLPMVTLVSGGCPWPGLGHTNSTEGLGKHSGELPGQKSQITKN